MDEVIIFGEVVEKFIQPVTGFKMLHQDTYGNARSGEHRPDQR